MLLNPRILPLALCIGLLALVPPVLPLLTGGSYALTLLLQIFLWTTLALSWNFFCGYSGYSSFGHGAFFGVGAYTTATLVVQFDMPFLLTLPVAGALSALIALLVGVVVFRLPRFRGELFSLLTLVLGFVLATIANNIAFIDGGRGVFLRSSSAGQADTSFVVSIYYVGLMIVALTAFIARAIYLSRWGAALFAIRDDEGAAEGIGIGTLRYKLATFALSSFIVGLAGGTQAMFLGYIEVSNIFTITTPLLALMMAILGGSGRWYGPIIGAVLITLLRQTFTSGGSAALNQMFIGVVLILTILFLPRGIAGTQWTALPAIRRLRTDP